MSLVMPNGQPAPAQQGNFVPRDHRGSTEAYDRHNTTFNATHAPQPPQNGPPPLGSPPNGGSPWDPYNAQVQDAYRRHLGRDATVQELGGHHGGNPYGWSDPNQLNSVLTGIENSEEARNYRNNPQRQSPSVDTTGANRSGGGGGGGGASYPAAPHVPTTFNIGNMVDTAMRDAPQLNSQFQPQHIKDFIAKEFTAPSYRQSTFSQFNDPRNMDVQTERDALLLNMLRNPESMGQTMQDQLFEQQKDDALAFAKQFGLQQEQQLAGRGFSNYGGVAQQMRTDLNQDLASELLSGRRNIAAQASRQNFQDRLGALSAGEAGLSGDMGRQSELFRNLLAGQHAQAEDNRFGSQFALNTEQLRHGVNNQNYQSYLAGRGLQGQENARAEQFRQSAFGLSEQARNNARNSAIQQFLAQNNTDLGWANYGLSADQQFLNFLNGM